MRTLLPLMFALFALQLQVFAQLPGPNLTERHWKVDGTDRTALIYAPESAKSKPSPLIFAFHGHGGTAQNAARRMNFQRLWPEAIVVYMQGLPTPGALTDPTGKLPGWQKVAGDQMDRDLKFFDAVLDTVQKDYKVDRKQIFCTGHSNGGGFTYLLWAERGDTFAAVAPSAAIPNRNLKNLKPKPAMHIAGTNDQLVRYAWQEKAMEAERTLNRSDSKGKEWAKAGNVTATLYPSKAGTPYITAIFPGPHAFPSEAVELVVKFFKSYADLDKPTVYNGNEKSNKKIE